jgi:hypothetical protein
MKGNRAMDVTEKTQDLLQGPLKHVRAAALAAALLPLASVAATPALAQDTCSGGAVVGDFVWYDANNNGIQDAGEAGIANAVVTLDAGAVGVPDVLSSTNEFGWYQFVACPGDYRILVQIPNGMQPSPANAGADDTIDSDGIADGLGNSVVTFTVGPFDDTIDSIDFGFWAAPVAQPGTGTPGYWKNHPEAWPVETIVVGGVTYTKAQAIAILETSGAKDKTYTMFSSLVPAMLNVAMGNDSSCVASTIAEAQTWMATYGPVGSGIKASTLAWKKGEPLHRLMDNYNNGMLCAPHRD